MLKDLSTLIEDLTERGYHPIVMGDFNGTLEDDDLRAFLQTHNLHGLIGETNQGEPPPSYAVHPRGSGKVWRASSSGRGDI